MAKKKDKRFRFELGIPGLVFVVGLLVCLFLWMFILGFWLGQKMVISETKKVSFSVLKEALQAKGEKRVSPPLVPEEVKTPQVVPESRNTLKGLPSRGLQGTGKSVERPQGQGKDGQETRALTSRLDKTGKLYSIQVASFRSPKEADRYTKMLRDKGYEAFVKKVELPKKGIWYRIYVGRFKTFKEAKNFGITLQKKEKIKTFYITRLGGGP